MMIRLKTAGLVLAGALFMLGFEARMDERLVRFIVPDTHPWKTLSPQAFSVITEETRRELRENSPKQIPVLPSLGFTRTEGVIRKFARPDEMNNWRNGCLAWGLAEAYRTNRNPDDLRAVESFFSEILGPDGRFKEKPKSVEQAICGWVLLEAYEKTGNPRYFTAAEELAQAYLHSLPRTETGLLPYNPAKKGMFVDTVGMLCPFLARYGRIAKDENAQALAIRQIDEFWEIGMDAKSGLPWHAYQDGKPYGLLGWSRGAGWLAVGMAGTLNELPRDHPQRARLAERWKILAGRIASEQQGDGLWSWAMTIPDAPADSSAAALFSWAFQVSVESGDLPPVFQASARRAVIGLLACANQEGVVGQASWGSQGPGNYPKEFGNLSFAQGMATAAAARTAGPSDGIGTTP